MADNDDGPFALFFQIRRFLGETVMLKIVVNGRSESAPRQFFLQRIQPRGKNVGEALEQIDVAGLSRGGKCGQANADCGAGTSVSAR